MSEIGSRAVVVIVCGWIADKEKLKTYSRTAGPIMQRYGLKPVASYKPLAAMEGDLLPDVVNILEYPDEETCRRALADSEYEEKALPIRREAFSRLTITMARG